MNFDVVSPATSAELLKVLNNLDGKEYRLGAGYSDLLLELKRESNDHLTVVNIANLDEEEFTSIKQEEDNLHIGALVTAKEILADKTIQSEFQVLHKAAFELASPQIRQVATIGGNLCTASPAGDMSCALMALEAVCHILSINGTIRTLVMKDFFVDVRKSGLQKGDVLQRITIPVGNKYQNIYSDFIKIGTRRSMECAVISLAYHIYTDKKDNILQAGVAIGSAAPTIKFAEDGCTFLQGKNYSSINQEQIDEFTDKVLSYASPISDVRGSAWYRKEVLNNICKTIFKD